MSGKIAVDILEKNQKPKEYTGKTIPVLRVVKIGYH